MDGARRDVTLVRWPTEKERRETLQRLGLPRLLVLDRDAAPPSTLDVLEDWVRQPISEADIRARINALLPTFPNEVQWSWRDTVARKVFIWWRPVKTYSAQRRVVTVAPDS